ncbi:site-2 protease family protein [Haloarcula onubensis]|uniref:Site-2 protease family protein n=1 Tax=Haloarcula onubensis TaxID=2950539 RepID=A0ABU2FIK6_9EURY|nr:site-2 protease family protein [Halomicroarcula sp. S3CR25-11]MDS0280578.1 site-2 protease family protein [Halomicroarcula sp. S3CR25-11]
MAGMGATIGRIADRVAAVEDRLNDHLPPSLKVGLGVLYWFSTRKSARFDAFADRPLVRRWSDLAILTLFALQVGTLALVTVAAGNALGREPTALNDPVNTVAIPGVNDFMPLASTPYIALALVVATVVHEGGHALACRAEGVPIEEWGVALLGGVVPLAGYVLPADALDEAGARTRMRVFALGVQHNLVVTLLTGAVLLSPLTASPTEAFLTYFGWAATGGTAPTAAAVAALGPLTNVCFWLVLLNANVGLLNALPVGPLDGGRVLSESLAALGERTGYAVPSRLRRTTLFATSSFVVGLLVVAILGPYL